jgi:hypothetical protein
VKYFKTIIMDIICEVWGNAYSMSGNVKQLKDIYNIQALPDLS